MSGHNKWSSIKHKKGREDAKRGKIFTKLIKEITVASRIGGGDPGGNPRLRTALDRATAANMPKDNMERAIKRGTGELEGVNYEEYTYEGYGPEGVAVFVEALTDNKNRTVSEIRHMFAKHNGNLGEDGCVAWQFERRGLVLVSAESVEDEDTFLLEAIDAGADDVQKSTDENDKPVWEVYTDFTSLNDVEAKLRASGYKVTEAAPTRVPTSTVPLNRKQAEKVLNFIDALDDHDDVQNVYANFDIPEDVLDEIR